MSATWSFEETKLNQTPNIQYKKKKSNMNPARTRPSLLLEPRTCSTLLAFPLLDFGRKRELVQILRREGNQFETHEELIEQIFEKYNTLEEIVEKTTRGHINAFLNYNDIEIPRNWMGRIDHESCKLKMYQLLISKYLTSQTN